MKMAPQACSSLRKICLWLTLTAFAVLITGAVTLTIGLVHHQPGAVVASLVLLNVGCVAIIAATVIFLCLTLYKWPQCRLLRRFLLLCPLEEDRQFFCPDEFPPRGHCHTLPMWNPAVDCARSPNDFLSSTDTLKKDDTVKPRIFGHCPSPLPVMTPIYNNSFNSDQGSTGSLAVAVAVPFTSPATACRNTAGNVPVVIVTNTPVQLGSDSSNDDQGLTSVHL